MRRNCSHRLSHAVHRKSRFFDQKTFSGIEDSLIEAQFVHQSLILYNYHS